NGRSISSNFFANIQEVVFNFSVVSTTGVYFWKVIVGLFVVLTIAFLYSQAGLTGLFEYPLVLYNAH
ncbi:hypothetical protein, partial [Bacteroides finegoldii]|uniref:hypothetical protein n=1 Tax=Bacteroides finegoldii TaxID=338188 RepID=UPI00196158FC